MQDLAFPMMLNPTDPNEVHIRVLSNVSKQILELRLIDQDN